jgi:hypothetical protein
MFSHHWQTHNELDALQSPANSPLCGQHEALRRYVTISSGVRCAGISSSFIDWFLSLIWLHATLSLSSTKSSEWPSLFSLSPPLYVHRNYFGFFVRWLLAFSSASCKNAGDVTVSGACYSVWCLLQCLVPVTVLGACYSAWCLLQCLLQCLVPVTVSGACYSVWCLLQCLVPVTVPGACYSVWCLLQCLVPVTVSGACYSAWCLLPCLVTDKVTGHVLSQLTL